MRLQLAAQHKKVVKMQQEILDIHKELSKMMAMVPLVIKQVENKTKESVDSVVQHVFKVQHTMIIQDILDEVLSVRGQQYCIIFVKMT